LMGSNILGPANAVLSSAAAEKAIENFMMTMTRWQSLKMKGSKQKLSERLPRSTSEWIELLRTKPDWPSLIHMLREAFTLTLQQLNPNLILHMHGSWWRTIHSSLWTLCLRNIQS
jgi:hypothetical protein